MDPIDDVLSELETAYDADVLLRPVRLYEEIEEVTVDEAARRRKRLLEWRYRRPPLPQD